MAFLLSRVVSPPPNSWLVNATSLVILAFLGIIGLFEVIGKHLQYSKFWNSNQVKGSSNFRKHIVLSSKNGMLLMYGPTFLACVASFWLFPNGGLRNFLVKLALSLHFFKRIFEVLFLHKYSGGVAIDSAIIISFGYFSAAFFTLYAQHLAKELPEPSVDLKFPGLVLFLLGESGNFYHHYLLASLREKGERGYKIPKAGLFSLIICPHYLFEILCFVGIFLISQTICSLSVSIGVGLYLMGRSYVTRKWYLSKFEDFPKHVKALIPFVY